ncbi:MAG: DUF7594 domain-containing protein, partial [Candidatus Binatia bacterium]
LTLAGNAPAVAITAPNTGTVVFAGDPVTLSGTANDVEDGNLSARLTWTSNLNSLLGTGPTYSTTALSVGTHTLTAAATDSSGLSGSAQIALAVRASGVAPTVTITAPAAGTRVVAGTPLNLAATALDDVDGSLSASITWSSSIAGALGTGATLTPTLGAGTHIITAAATDRDGLRGSAQVVITVNAPSPNNAVPVVVITAPRDGRACTAEDMSTFTGFAEDREDGLVTSRLTWTSDRDGALGGGGRVTHTLSTGTHRITASVVDSGGQQSAAMVTVNVVAPATVSFNPSADTYVNASKPTSKYGTSSTLLLQGSPVRQGFVRFVLTNVPPDTVARAVLRLTVGSGSSDGSTSGGTVYAITNHTWQEATTNYKTRPLVDGPALASRGPVTTNQVVDFDVTAAVNGNGTYDFALVTSTTDSLRYRSREAASGKPELVITQGCPQITFAGIYANGYDDSSIGLDTTIDASAATWLGSPTNSYPLNLGGSPGALLIGGVVRGQYDRTWSWTQMHGENNAGVAFGNPQTTIDGLRVDNATDGVRPLNGGNFVIRNVWLSYIRDDCVENDHVHGGVVEDSLFDGCYDGFSARPSPVIAANGANGSSKVWRIHDTLVRLQPMPGPDGAGTVDNLGHLGFFKWDSWTDPTTSLSPKLALHNNVFMAERVGQAGADRMGIPPGQVVSCSNNVMVWLGPGTFPAPLPACFTVTNDRTVWDNAVADWKRRHPQMQP